MASESGRSLLLAKYGSRLAKAAAAHQHEEAKVAGGYSELPAGINGGVAQVKKCYFDTYKTGDNKGEYFFYAAAVVVSPITFQGEQIAGKMTVLPIEPVCDTPNRSRKTLEDHVEWIQNELKKMGCPTSLLSADNLEQAAEWIRKRKPHIRFRTWKGEKQKTGPYKDREPQVRHEWGGTIVYQESDETLAARAVMDTESSGNGDDNVDTEDVEVVDNNEGDTSPSISEKPGVNFQAESVHPRLATATSPTRGKDSTDTDADGAESEVATAHAVQAGTAKDLVAKANNEDQDAIRVLSKMAEDVGITTHQVDSATSWDEVYRLVLEARLKRKTPASATAITTTSTAAREEVPYVSKEEVGEEAGHSSEDEESSHVELLEEESAEEEEEDHTPKVGTVYLLKLTDPKTGKATKPRQVEILSVNDQIETVDVKVSGTTKKIPRVSWKRLMPLT